jgi:hypothetical protein
MGLTGGENILSITEMPRVPMQTDIVIPRRMRRSYRINNDTVTQRAAELFVRWPLL